MVKFENDWMSFLKIEPERDEEDLENEGRFFVPRASLTLELVTVGDLALPVAGLFVQIKGQSTGTRDWLQAGFCTPEGGKGRSLINKIMICFLLSS